MKKIRIHYSQCEMKQGGFYSHWFKIRNPETFKQAWINTLFKYEKD